MGWKMTDLQKVELAARRNGDAIMKSVWLDEHSRRFLSNAFLAFADEIREMRKPSFEPTPYEEHEIIR